MPLRPDSGDELSLRHLPDATDTSISFQIPSSDKDKDNYLLADVRPLPDASDTSISLQMPTSDKDEYLLADDDSNFFKGTDVSIATPAPFRTAYDVLTLSQLSPRPEGPFDFRFFQKSPPPPTPQQLPSNVTPRTNRSRKAKASPAAGAANSTKLSTMFPSTATKSEGIVSQPYQLPSGEASPSRARLSTLRAEVESLTDDLEPASSLVAQAPTTSPSSPAMRSKPKGIRESLNLQRRESTRLKSKRTVIEGGITKPKNRTPPSSKVSSLANAVSRPIPPPAVTNTNTNASMPIPTKHHQPEAEFSSETLDLDFVNESNPDISIISATSGVAGRLVSYGQQFIGSSFGLVASDQLSVPITRDPEPKTTLSLYPQLDPDDCISGPLVVNGADPQDTPEKILQLTDSQLSPPKLAREPQIPEISASCSTITASAADHPLPSSAVLVPPVPMSPMRRAIKRGRPDAAATTNKKSKTEPASFAGTSTTSAKGKASAAETEKEIRTSSTRRQPTVLDSSSSSKSPSRGRPDSRLVQNRGGQRRKQAPVNKSGNSQRHERQGLSWRKSATLRAETVRSKRRVELARGLANCELLVNEECADQGQGRGHEDVGSSKPPPPRVKHDIVKAVQTQPIEFKFQLDSRIPARKAQQPQGDSATMNAKGTFGQSRPLSTSTSTSHNSKSRRFDLSSRIPDFKALHAVHDTGLAQRKENVRPTVPVPIEFATEHRAKERRKFEEHVREVEREKEVEREARRRERELEDEREIRELRRKAIPKAHEVPEWYKDAPKRKERSGDT
ncbi:hypothetical protein BDQ17DRAFT_1346205, partial [Cyathus striatus]